MLLDDNALFRHFELAEMRDADEETPEELEARRHGLSYVKLDGEIGCMVNGAGLAMATMDITKLYGGEPANFLDIGGGAQAGKVAAALRIILSACCSTSLAASPAAMKSPVASSQPWRRFRQMCRWSPGWWAQTSRRVSGSWPRRT